MIEVRELTKTYRGVTAVDALSFRVEQGTVTGFLGPNGAGKSTTMRMMVGLDRPTSGWARIDDRDLIEFASPLREIGVLLDAGAAPAGMTARDHLRWLARAGGIPAARIDAVTDRVGLADADRRPIGTMSLGMRQRVGLAAALLGDPATLILDEPVNGLDPDGVRWLRTLLRGLADEGRTVLLSSHLMSEMQATADHVVVIGQGRLVAELDVADLTDRAADGPVRLRTADPAAVVAELRRGGHTVTARALPDGAAELTGATAEQIGAAAHDVDSPVFELTPRRDSLEDVYMALTEDTTEYRATAEATR